jgi:hypothetical protein
MMAVARLPDWEPRLHAALDAAANRPFQHGQHDCCLFIADVVLVLTGHDFGAPFRGKYRTAAGAMRALRQSVEGGGDMRHQVTAALGEPVHPAFAGFGDVVEFPDGLFGIHARSGAFVLSEDAGLLRVPLTAAINAWVIPHG